MGSSPFLLGKDYMEQRVESISAKVFEPADDNDFDEDVDALFLDESDLDVDIDMADVTCDESNLVPTDTAKELNKPSLRRNKRLLNIE